MLNPINELISKGRFAGVAINIHPADGGQLSVVITAKLPPMQNTAHLDSAGNTKAARDAYFNVREALATPLVFTGDTDALEADIASFVDSISESMVRASEAMKASAVAAKLDAASVNAEEAPKKKTTNKPKKADAKVSEKEESAPPTEVDNAEAKEAEVKATDAPKAPDAFADFDDIDSI